MTASLIRNDQIQAGMVERLKANATVTAQLPAGATEIREDQWQGREFVYPNIRVRLISNVPTSGYESCPQDISMGIMAFSQLDSSQEADRIAGIISNELHGISFTASNGVHFYLFAANLIPAVRSDIRTWRSEVILRGRVT